mgnify:CR=1 FL=1
MIPFDINPAIVNLTGYTALSTAASILIIPAPVDTSHHSGSGGYVLELSSYLTTFTAYFGLCLLGTLAHIIADTDHSTIDLKTA